MSLDHLAKTGSMLMSGAEFHSRMVEYFTFLGLDCFREFQDCQMKDELDNYHNFMKHVFDRHKMLLHVGHTKLPKVVPEEFYENSAMQLDEKSIQQYLKKGMDMYLDWEHRAKKHLENCAVALLEEGEVAGYNCVMDMAMDVAEEIYNLENFIIYLKSISYDLNKATHLRTRMGLK